MCRMERYGRKLMLTVAVLMALYVAPAAFGQTLELQCRPPTPQSSDGSCMGKMALTDSIWRQTVEVRVLRDDRAAAGVWVKFRPTSGMLTVDSALTNSAGDAGTLWFRNRGTDAVGIVAEVRTAMGSATRYIHLEATPENLLVVTRYRLRPHSGDGQAWFEKSTLRFPLYVEILRVDSTIATGVVTETAITNPIICRQQRVAFSKFTNSGVVTPDTTNGNIEVSQLRWATVGAGANRKTVPADPNREGCFAHANWTLDGGAGYRHARASLLGPATIPGRSSHQFEVIARAFPRLIAGLALDWTPAYQGRKGGDEDTIHVERRLPDGSKLIYDSTFTTGVAARDVEGHFTATPVVGITTALFPRISRLAVTAGVNLSDPTEDWYFGISLPQLLGRFGAESFPVSVHLLSHWGKSPELVNPAACPADNKCETRNRTGWHYFSLMGSIDAGTLVTDLIKGLGLP